LTNILELSKVGVQNFHMFVTNQSGHCLYIFAQTSGFHNDKDSKMLWS